MIAKFDKTNKSAEVRLWLSIDEIEPQAQHQIHETAKLPWVHSVAIMPDAHMGIGATVGSVVATREAISPSCVGVDLACGMMAIPTSLTPNSLPDDLKGLRLAIEAAVPVGFNMHDKDPGKSMPDIIKYPLQGFLNEFKDLRGPVQDQLDRAVYQIGTLGGGNHFIELCLDTGYNSTCKDDKCGEWYTCDDCLPKVWIMLHSGSRGIGNKLAQYHINIAKKLAHNHDLPDPDLAAFMAGTPEMEAYRHDLYWAQEYAVWNRIVMMQLVKDVMRKFFKGDGIDIMFGNAISCHHNYVAEETHFGEQLFVTRKGAINAEKGTYGIIPGSMGTKSYIVKGLGKPDSFNSASHGAGRRMSRTKAKKEFNLKDFAEQTKGVECRKDSGVLDEIPGAYKDIDQVMANQSDLVEIVHELKQILCVKG